MADTFEGPVDARQAQKPISPTRFRPRYRQLTAAELALHDDIKDKAQELLGLMHRILPPFPEKATADQGRAVALATTKLEESVMWAIKGLTS